MFLASDAALSSAGQALNVSGGWASLPGWTLEQRSHLSLGTVVIRSEVREKEKKNMPSPGVGSYTRGARLLKTILGPADGGRVWVAWRKPAADLERHVVAGRSLGIKLSLAALVLLVFSGCFVGAPAHSRDIMRQIKEAKPDVEFTRLAVRLSEQRLAGDVENEKLQEQAMAILDGVILAALNSAAEADLAALNQHLAALVTDQPSIGEDFRVTRLEGARRVYALAANFGLGGPSAVRLYTGMPGRYALAGRIDHFMRKDFFDEYLELIPIPGGESVFVTVTGRTDELQTGAFAAWYLDGDRLRALWSTEILPQSSYESIAKGFLLTYCAEADEDNPRICRHMSRDRYAWDGAAWQRVEQKALPVPKR